MKTQLIVALDVPDTRSAAGLIARLPQNISWCKIGAELFCSAGPACLAPAQRAGKKIFLDLKFHDIPRTVGAAVAAATRHGVHMLTLHAAGGRAMLREAVRVARDHGPTAPILLGVTVLTSLGADDLRELGVRRAPRAQALALGELALSCGLDGLVASPQEARRMREKLGSRFTLVTPGIRPAASPPDDQRRTATPAEAMAAGANYLVVGRPIVAAPDPALAARLILAEMQ